MKTSIFYIYLLNYYTNLQPLCSKINRHIKINKIKQMKISELSDEEVLNFLMTSDFNDGSYSPSELKYLLTKWRYFYRLLNGKSEQIKIYSDGVIKRIHDDNTELNDKIIKLKDAIDTKEKEILSLKDRKLSFRERWSGKIIIK